MYWCVQTKLKLIKLQATCETYWWLLYVELNYIRLKLICSNGFVEGSDLSELREIIFFNFDKAHGSHWRVLGVTSVDYKIFTSSIEVSRCWIASADACLKIECQSASIVCLIMKLVSKFSDSLGGFFVLFSIR